MGHNFDNPIYYDQSKREEYNNKYNFEKYFNDYGTKDVVRMWMVFEEGAVCGGLTQTYSLLADIFGRPSSPCGQPGHAASVTYEWNKNNNRYEWVIQNDVSGWVETGNQFDDRMLGWGDQWKTWSKWTNASYTVLAGDAVLDYENYEKANLLVLLADSYTDNNEKKKCYEKALEHQKINLDAMEGLINCYKANTSTTSKEYLELAKGIIEAYNYYPQTMMELLALIEPYITDANDVVQLDILKNNALLRASKSTLQESTCVSMTKQMANHYLNNNANNELATFSFDGENGGKIVLNSKYEDSQIRIGYSLDGGNKWTETDEHIIELTDEEIASITAENDIKLSLVGVSDVHTIDILPGKTITTSAIYANDSENLLIGSEQNLSNLEFSTDGGNTWCSYVGGLDGTRLEGNKTVKVRYKAYGQYLQSDEATYTFTENTDTVERKYIPLKNVSLVDFTSQQSTSNDHAAVNFIDGNPNSAWHTAYRHEINKFYTVSFDKERYITALEYLPGNGANGRLRSGEILTSLDGTNWEVSGTFTDIGNNTQLKELNLDKPTKAKYVKLVATHTYGNSDGERDKYFSGKDITFYEDTTIVESGPTTEPEVPEDDFDNGMNVNPDNIPSKPQEPEDNLDSDMGVNPGPEVPDNEFDSDMEVNPDEDQVVENTPVVLPDDIPVEDIKPDIPVEDIKPDSEGWTNTTTLAQMHQLWNYTFDEANQIIVLDSFKGTTQINTDLKVVIPRTIEGYKVALADLKSDMFPGVTHIKVAEAKDGEGQVKVLATNLMNGFAKNDTLKFVSLSGLDVSKVDNMYGLFSFCKNLRVLEINDLVIKNTTDIMSMFYAAKDDTFDERKILVITNNERIANYNFEQSNRVPAIVTFNANGGYFLGDEEILNMKVPRFTIHPGVLEELDKVIESDVNFAGIPTREGFKFTGWYTEDKTPTNVYELLNMTYKAKWEEVVEEETPEDNTPNLPNIEYIDGTGGANTPCTLKVNTEEGLGSVMNWLNDKSINMSYYRLKDIINNPDGTITYQLHVFSANKLVSYININIDSSNAELMNKLNAINVLIGIEDINSNGAGSKEKPYEVKVNTIGGMSQLLDWLIVNCNNYHKSITVTEKDDKLIYEIYAVLSDTESSIYTNSNKEIYIKVVVDKANDEVIEYINDAIETAPDNDFDNDMMVDPDNDQVVDDSITTLPDDVPVDTDDTPVTLPDDVPVDSTDTPVILPDDFEVDTNKPNDGDFVEDNMGVNPDTDQVVDDTPTILPDDVIIPEKPELPPANNDNNTSEGNGSSGGNGGSGNGCGSNGSGGNDDDDENNEDNTTEDTTVEDGTHMDDNTVKPELERPDNDLDNDMMVNPEEDQVVEDKPTILPDDVPVENVKPENDIDTDMGVNPDNIPSKPQVPEDDMDSDMGVVPDGGIVEDGTHNDDMTVNPDKDQVVEDKPEFNHDVIELIKGDGQENTPYEFTVKRVELDKFNSFLDELKEWNLKFVSVTRENGHILYNLKIDKKLRSLNDSIHIVLKIKDDQTEILSALNELKNELYPSTETDKFEGVLDGTANDDMMVEPEIEAPSVDGGVTPDKDDTTNDSNINNGITSDTSNNGNTNNNTANGITNNPTTGDVGIAGYVGLGLASVLGLFKNRRKRK